MVGREPRENTSSIPLNFDFSQAYEVVGGCSEMNRPAITEISMEMKPFHFVSQHEVI